MRSQSGYENMITLMKSHILHELQLLPQNHLQVMSVKIINR